MSDMEMMQGTFVVSNGVAQLVSNSTGETLGQFVFGPDPKTDIDTTFLLFSAYLVFFMQAGFAMLSAGSVRAKNTKTIILKNLLDSCVGAVCFWLLGYGFAFGDEGNKFIGHGNFGFHDLPKFNKYAFWLFQFAFCAAASSIVSGAVEERMGFPVYMLYAVYLTSFVYPVVAHWVWSTTGWLSAFRKTDVLLDTGMLDFAGCGVVHMVGGITGLIGAFIVGPRIGRFDSNGKAQPMPGHSAALTILGVFLLWFGWYGFNPGSALTFVNNSNVAAMAAVNTTMSASCATLSALGTLMLIEYLSTGMIVWDLIGAGNGTLAGLVAITANCGFVETWAAAIIGLMAGVIYCGASYTVLNILKVDDPLDAVAVHGANGMWGLIAAAAFASEFGLAGAYAGQNLLTVPDAHGFIMGGNGKLLGCAIIGILAITAWCILTMVPFFLGMKALGILRVSPEEEMAGLDVSHHGGSAYHGDMPETKPGVFKEPKGGASADYEHIKSLEATVLTLTSRMTALEARGKPDAAAVV